MVIYTHNEQNTVIVRHLENVQRDTADLVIRHHKNQQIVYQNDSHEQNMVIYTHNEKNTVIFHHLEKRAT